MLLSSYFTCYMTIFSWNTCIPVGSQMLPHLECWKLPQSFRGSYHVVISAKPQYYSVNKNMLKWNDLIQTRMKSWTNYRYRNCSFSTYFTVKRRRPFYSEIADINERCPLMGGNLKKIITFGTKYFVRFSWHVHYLGYPLLGGFTILSFLDELY